MSTSLNNMQHFPESGRFPVKTGQASVFFLFSRCDDCGPIKMAGAVILTRPFIWLVAPLVLSFILSICHTAEHASIVLFGLMLKICCPLMWWFSGGDFHCGATGDWRGRRFQIVLDRRQVNSESRKP